MCWASESNIRPMDALISKNLQSELTGKQKTITKLKYFGNSVSVKPDAVKNSYSLQKDVHFVFLYRKDRDLPGSQTSKVCKKISKTSA